MYKFCAKTQLQMGTNCSQTTTPTFHLSSLDDVALVGDEEGQVREIRHGDMRPRPARNFRLPHIQKSIDRSCWLPLECWVGKSGPSLSETWTE
jgi:hypothetical protein